MTRRLFAASLAVACLALAACDNKKPTNNKNGTTDDNPSDNVDIGNPLFAPAPYKPAQAGARAPDPVTVPMANVVILRKVDLPSEVDGAVRWVGVEVDEATAAGLPPTDVFRNPRDKKAYRRLVPGEFVKRGQIVAFLDDDQAFIEWQGANTKAKAAKDSAAAYVRTVEKLRQIVQQQREGAQKGIVPLQELYNSEATLARYQADLVDHEGSAAVSAAEAERAQVALNKRTLRAAEDGEVQQILKQPGEGVRPSEPVLVIHNFDRLRAVGNLPKEYLSVVAPGQDVTLETPRDVPAGTVFDQHTTSKPIAAVAVTTVGGKPVIVSAGEDGWVYAWDRDLNRLGSWRQPAGVRCLAVTRAGTDPALLLVGGANGTARVYDLGHPEKKEPVREFEGRHDGGVAAAAFSPDGKFCVTADDHAIFMYDVVSAKRKYTFPAREHHSAITALHFTPQGRVVSAGREPWVRVWVVGDQNARVEHRIDSRSGDVPMPGVTDDGSRLLLDADKTRLDVFHLQDLRKERPLVTAGEGGRFTTFTAWSPALDGKDNHLIATTGGVEGVVQLWRAPTGDARGA
ncbi:MAG TPA: HlyD family efflux transporter periplasmic adaptor subunit, partial [Gemmataceae bacterium]|nr:HlyD family efflux transporter periplasmic adaptor subunit [Gemmataceae bacterium]